MFNHSDPTVWSLCLRAATGKKENPTDLIRGLWQGFKLHVIEETLCFFYRVIQVIRKRKRQTPLRRANFELLALYAVVNQANSNAFREEGNYSRWRRRRYPLGMAYSAKPQMDLPLHEIPVKRSVNVLLEAEKGLRQQFVGDTEKMIYKQQAFYH